MNRFLKVALGFVLLLTIGGAGIVSAQYNTPASITVTLNNVENSGDTGCRHADWCLSM